MLYKIDLSNLKGTYDFMQTKMRFWTVQCLIILLIVFVGTKIAFIFHPIGVFVSTLFFPVLIAGFLFFILSPIVNFAVQKKVPKPLAILLIYVVFTSIIVLVGFAIGPVIGEQIVSLTQEIPSFIKSVGDSLTEWANSDRFAWILNQDIINIKEIEARLIEMSSTISKNLVSGVTGFFSVVTQLAVILVIVPFILFYMLKDGHRLPDQLVRFVPINFREEAYRIIEETGQTLAHYIQGQMIVCVFVAVASTVGYMIIGLDFALLFGVIIGIVNVIPYLGPWIGATPAVIVAFLDSPLTALLVIIVILIVQQVDSNVISPQIIGSKLEVHPLTIMLLLLVAANLAGVLGMILAVPTYAVSKTLVKNLLRIWRLRSAS